ncbi:MAG: beta-N-acetylhexosaminidase [Kiritimatiellae bacterium]|nr:beta-N-acetylhexosaminidase [Kiritimatiellia bacterium]
MQKNIKMIGAAVAFAMGLSCVVPARAADAAFEADSARLAALLAEPQKGDRLLWMRKGPFVAESGKLFEHRALAKSLLARIDKEREGADAARKEVLRRRSIVWRIVAGSPDAPARLSSTPFCGELQECALTLDRTDEFGAFVDDPLASDGRAVKMFNSHHEWCVMLMMNRIAFEPGVKYRVRARVRCEGTGTARGNAFTAGVFDERAWKSVGYTARRANAVGPDYAWYDICTFVPSDGQYFWIGPGGLNKDGDKNANAVLLDKISFEPVPEEKLAIIPAPQKMSVTGGECRLKGAPKVENVASIPPEGYELSITKGGVTIRCSDDAGAFYARMTLAQIEKVDPKTKQKIYPCVEIVDAPKFKWRGVLLDTARHFLGKTAILRVIDEMAWYKLNVLQIHFTDGDSWTLEIPEFPELVKQGVARGRSGFVYGEKLQPFYYSTKDVQEIVAYAAARHVKVVPEIEMPGHFEAALRAYPSMKCKCPGGGRVFCIGNPETVRFAEKVLDRVCEIFPSDVIHFGGDECTRKYWKECPVCQAHIKREGLKGVEEIQPWLTRHLVEYLAKKGRRAIGWDEIFLASSWEKWDDFLKAGGDSFNSLLPKTTMGMCWRPWGAGALAANRGYEIVRCPTSNCYFDFSQGLPEDPFPYFGRGVTSLEKVYRFDVLEGVEPQARKNVVGGQCCNWAERTPNITMLEWKLWPRALALSEALWTYPDPAKRDFAEFSQRAAAHRLRLIRSHVNCAPLK